VQIFHLQLICLRMDLLSCVSPLSLLPVLCYRFDIYIFFGLMNFVFSFAGIMFYREFYGLSFLVIFMFCFGYDIF
jgi:hypothetical protein